MATAAIAPRVPEDLRPGTKDAPQLGPSGGKVLPAEKAPRFLRIDTASKPTSAIPQEIQFGALHSPILRLNKPIPLRVEKSEGTLAVVWDEIQEFGYGNSLSDAIFDFSATLAELFITLSKEKSLGADLLRVKNKLSEYIEPRPR